jgi:hypothetical protein
MLVEVHSRSSRAKWERYPGRFNALRINAGGGQRGNSASIDFLTQKNVPGIMI